MNEEMKQQVRERIGNRIAALRKKAGLTQEELALRAGLQRTHVGRIEATYQELFMAGVNVGMGELVGPQRIHLNPET